MKYPLQIYDIDDVEEWRNSFFYPLSKDNTDNVVNKETELLLFEIFDLFDKDEKYLFRIIAKRLKLELFSFFSYLLLSEKISELKLDIKDKHNSLTGMLLNKEFTKYPFISFDTSFLDGKLSLRRFLSQCKGIIYELTHPKKNTNYDGILFGWNPTSLKVAEKIFTNPLYLKKKDVLKQRYHFDKCISREISISTQICDLARNAYAKLSAKNINEQLLNKLASSMARFINRVNFDFNQCNVYLENSKFKHPITMIVGTGGYPTRIFSEALKKYGAKIIGTPHGGGLSGLDFPELKWIEFLTVTHFAAFSKREVDDYKRHLLHNINKIQFPLYEDVEFSLLNVKPYNYLNFDFSQVKTIMHLSPGIWGDDLYYGMASDIQNLDFQIQIIDYFLQFKNKHYIFKERPKTAYKNGKYTHLGYYVNSNIEYEYKPLMDVIDTADMFIVECVGSSALWEIMHKTDKPIILFKPALPIPFQSFWDSIGKRCFIIDKVEDDQNKKTFDVSRLNKLLTNPSD